MARDLMTGSYKVWNRLLRDMRTPPPFYNVSQRTPAPLRWGKEHEDQACAIWWDKHPALDLANPVCVAYHDTTNTLWARNVVVSPDRMIYDPAAGKWVSGFELKCPFLQENHEQWRNARACPEEHYDQCAFGQLVTNIHKWVFCSFDPRQPNPDDQFFEVQVPVQQSYLDKMYELGTRFLEMFESGNTFQPTSRTAKRFKEMFGGDTHAH
jgi:hypothetical protein